MIFIPKCMNNIYDNKNRDHLKQFKHLVQGRIKQANDTYLADILGVGLDGRAKIFFIFTKKTFFIN